MNAQTTSRPIDDLATVLGCAGELVATIRPDQWGAATPCPEWNVRALVNHMVLGNRLFAGILRGEATVEPDALDPKSSDALGEDPVAAYHGAAEELLAAFARPGVLEQVFQVPVGPVPGIAAIHLRAVEELVHGRDLATTTGEHPHFPDDIVERALEFTRGKLADIPPGRSPFAPPQPVPDNALPLDRLVALLGRSVNIRG